MKTWRIAVACVCCLVAARAWVRMDREARQRQELAASWSNDGPAFGAVGIDGETLDAHLPDALSAEDDGYVDAVLVDRELVTNLRKLGFVKLQCGTRVEVLKEKP
jgi:hypothetical protein